MLIRATLAAALFAAVPAAAQQGVTLSRYQVEISSGGREIGLTEMEDRCLDSDGCEISLLVYTTSSHEVGATSGRTYFLKPPGLYYWFTSARMRNADNIVDIGLTATAGDAKCELTDGDLFVDDGPGFSLRLDAVTEVAVCYMVVMD